MVVEDRRLLRPRATSPTVEVEPTEGLANVVDPVRVDVPPVEEVATGLADGRLEIPRPSPVPVGRRPDGRVRVGRVGGVEVGRGTPALGTQAAQGTARAVTVVAAMALAVVEEGGQVILGPVPATVPDYGTGGLLLVGIVVLVD